MGRMMNDGIISFYIVNKMLFFDKIYDRVESHTEPAMNNTHTGRIITINAPPFINVNLIKQMVINPRRVHLRESARKGR